ncbi:MAG: hypothetical protein Kow00117_14850 [Phototrophicales bacterium]
MFWLLNRIIKESEAPHHEDDIVQEPLEKLIKSKLAWQNYDYTQEDSSDEQH